MAFCESDLSKVLFITTTCERCGNPFPLRYLGIEFRYTLRGESSSKPNSPENKLVAGEIIFSVAGKCETENCGYREVQRFNSQQLLEAASKLAEDAEKRGVESSDILISSHSTNGGPQIM